MLDIVSILCLTPQLSPLVERVITILNVQDRFRFQVVTGASLPDPDKGQVYSFRFLDSLLLREKQRLGVRYLLGIMDQRNEWNCFSHSRWRTGTGFITTFGWEYLSWLPTHAFVAYAIVRNVVTMLGGRRSFHEETLGCLFDYCAHKPDYSFKIRTADICPECLDFLRTKLESPDLDAIVLLLEQIRLTALGRGAKVEPIGRSLSEDIDQVYPFPIAYCFRSMQAELSYSRKWLKLLDLYEVTIKYLAFVLLASLQQSLGAVPRTVAPHLAGLKRPSAGHWHEACFALLKACTDNSDPIFVGRFRESAGRKKAKQARAASEQLLPLRNDTKGHGFIEEEPQYQTRYDRHVSAIQLLMEFVRPLASYRLIKVGEGLRRRRGVSVFPAKVLMGSHPLFPVEQHQTDLPVDTDCLLYDPETKTYLTLFPWCEPTAHRLVRRVVHPPPNHGASCLREPTAAAGSGVG